MWVKFIKLNSCLESSGKHKSVLLKILSLGVMKGAYDYSSVAFRKKVYENEAVLASLRKRFDGLNPESSNYKILLRKIKFYESRLDELFKGPRDLSQFVDKWVSSFDVEYQLKAREAIKRFRELCSRIILTVI